MITRSNPNTKTGTCQEATNQPARPTELEKLAAQYPYLTEQQLKIRAWALRDPGSYEPVEDDDVDFQ